MARAMVETGDWWEPRLSGYGHYDKPPLVYWAAALAFRVLGFNEWAARLPSLLGAVAALAGLGWAAGRLHGPRVAWWALLTCGTLVQFWTCARLLTPDMLLTGWMTLAVGAWAECRHRGGAWRWWMLSLLFWSLAWWTKATPALVPLLGLAVGTLATGDRAGFRALRLPLLLPGTILLGLPWYAAMLQAHPDLWDFFLGKELAGRLAGGAHRRGGPWLYLRARERRGVAAVVAAGGVGGVADADGVVGRGVGTPGRRGGLDHGGRAADFFGERFQAADLHAGARTVGRAGAGAVAPAVVAAAGASGGRGGRRVCARRAAGRVGVPALGVAARGKLQPA